MKKIGSFISLICIINMLTLLGLGGYLFGTGRLDKPKAIAMIDLVKHQGTPEHFREQLYDILEPTTASAPASQAVAATVPTGDSLYTAVERNEAAQREIEQERLRLANEAQDLRHRQELLVQMQGEVTAKLAKIDADQKAFNTQVAASQNKSEDASFQKALALYDGLKPKQIKEMFLPMKAELVAKFLQAMDTDRSAKIIAEFKTTDEVTFIRGVLEIIRTSGTSAAQGSPATGNTPIANSGP